jgi:hypothetical protein
MRSDVRLRSRRFSTFPGRSHADVPPMCPGWFWSSCRIFGRPSKAVKSSTLDTCCQDTAEGETWLLDVMECTGDR